MSALASAPRRVAKRVVRIGSSSVVRVLGVDATAQIAGRSCLVVAPHPDDETLGCGATIARMRAQGTPVHVVVVSGGGQSPRPAGTTLAELLQTRRREAARALGVLGVDPASTQLWDFEDGAVAERRGDVEEALGEVLDAVRPEQVMVTSACDRHPDHATVAMATRAAVARHAASVPVLEYPIWQRVPAVNAVRGLGSGRPLLVATGEYLQRKSEAIRAYDSQLPHFPLGFVADFELPFETFLPTVV